MDSVVVQDTSLMVLRVLDSWEAVGLWPLVMGVYTILLGLDIILSSSVWPMVITMTNYHPTCSLVECQGVTEQG